MATLRTRNSDDQVIEELEGQGHSSSRHLNLRRADEDMIGEKERQSTGARTLRLYHPMGRLEVELGQDGRARSFRFLPADYITPRKVAALTWTMDEDGESCCGWGIVSAVEDDIFQEARL